MTPTGGTLLPILPQSEWVSDTSCSSCRQCQRPFNALTRRRHHCRCCGWVFCSACTTRDVRVFAIAPRPQDWGVKSAARSLFLWLMCRVCDGCYENWKEMERLSSNG